MSFASRATATVESQHYSEVVQLAPVIRPVTQIGSQNSQQTSHSLQQKWIYGLLAFAMIFGFAQALRCGVVSGVKLHKMINQLGVVSQVHQRVGAQNNVLQDKISLYSSPMGVEEMARERLDLVAKDEMLVRIYAPIVAQAKN